jgi:anaerobic selenocysteine-containing dehydrogenase/Fe-S-cluster-containing hydrogenase component 2
MPQKQKRYAMLIDLDRCIGCYACQVTCKAEYNIPFGTARCRIQTYQSGKYPQVKKFYIPHLCNHCDNAPCIEACEEQALFKNQDGVVEISNDKCTGCQLCYEKCPYDAIEASQYTGQAEKCDFCYSRVRSGLSPVCVQSCMGKAFIFGDMNDKTSEIAVALKRNQLKVLRPELKTNPSVFYVFTGKTGNSPLKNYKVVKGYSTRRISVKQHQRRRAEKAKFVYTSDAMCPSECGISVLVEKGIAKKIYGNHHSLINNGAFCAKGASGLQLTYSPHRIKTPLMRIGKRGDDKWKPVTWDEASDYIAKKLIDIKKKYGPESVFLDCGDVTDREAYYRLFHAFGTPNTYNHGSICDPNRKWGQWIMTGDERPLPDIQRPFLMRDENNEMYLNKKHDTRLLLHIGVNPFVATRFNYMSYGIPAARKENGCIYIVVDPAFTNSASRADKWLSIRPGTDTALLAAMLYYILKNDSPHNSSKEYLDHRFLEKYTQGWDVFKKAFLSYTGKKDPSNNLYFFSSEWAEEKTGIPKDEIEKLAHLFGFTKPAAIEIGMHGTAHHTNGDVTSILMTALCLITGNIDRPGGVVFIDSQKVKKGLKTLGKHFLEKEITREIAGKNISGNLSELHKDLYGDFPCAWKGVLADLPSKIRKRITLKHGPFKGYTYPVKAFITRAGNPVKTAGCTSDWIESLTGKDKPDEYSLELVVFIDTHITATGTYADIVLPEAGYLERMGLSDVYTMSPEVAIRDQVIKPLYESKTPFEIMIALSDALVKNKDPDMQTQDFSRKYKSEEHFIDELLSDSPGFYNIGEPLPYPDIPEGALILGAPDNPTAVWNSKIIRKGEPVTVQWLRKQHGVAVWPAAYYRYKKSDGFPSGIYPKTGSKKFEFTFGYIEAINKKLGTDYPMTFYWADCKWNPKNLSYIKMSKEYPFQLISGRVHSAMTLTTVCPYLAETQTECMKPLNRDFTFAIPAQEDVPDTYNLPAAKKVAFQKGTVSIPVFAFNKGDAEQFGLKTGDIVTLENPLKKTIKGKVYVTEEIMPGVIKTAFGPGGEKASGTGFVSKTAEYTPNINELFDPENISPYSGMPGFGDILVKIKRQQPA